jgi:hypothetical protein
MDCIDAMIESRDKEVPSYDVPRILFQVQDMDFTIYLTGFPSFLHNTSCDILKLCCVFVVFISPLTL